MLTISRAKSLPGWELEADPDVPFTMEISQRKYFSI
jgi:hypothetical protein